MPINKLLTLFSIFFLSSLPTSLCFADKVIPESLKTEYYQHCVSSMAKDKYFGKDEYTEERTSYFDWFCKCASEHVLVLLQTNASEEHIQDAYERCFDYGTLQYTVNSFENNEKVSQDKLEAACMETFKTVGKSPQDAPHVNLVQKVCSCAAPRLFKLNEDEELTDKEYDEQVNTIASECTDSAHQE